MGLCTNIFLMVWLLGNINELLLQCVHWAKRKCVRFPEWLHEVFIVLFLKTLFRDLVKNLSLLALFVLWLIALPILQVYTSYTEIFCFYLNCMLCLETSLHELQNKWSPNPNGFFLHSHLSFDSRSMIWGYSCCQKVSLPVSVPTSVFIKFTFLWSLGSWTNRNSLLDFGGGGWFVFGLFLVGKEMEASGILAPKRVLVKDQTLALRW